MATAIDAEKTSTGNGATVQSTNLEGASRYGATVKEDVAKVKSIGLFEDPHGEIVDTWEKGKLCIKEGRYGDAVTCFSRVRGAVWAPVVAYVEGQLKILRSKNEEEYFPELADLIAECASNLRSKNSHQAWVLQNKAFEFLEGTTDKQRKQAHQRAIDRAVEQTLGDL